MLSRVSALAKGLARDALAGFSRFPVPTVLVLVFALLSNLAVAEVWDGDDLARFLATLSLGSLAALAISLWAESHGTSALRRVGLSLGAAILAGLAVWFAHPFAYRVSGLSLAIILAIPLAPFLRRGQAAAFWSFGLWTLVGLVVAFASTLLFLIGLYAVVEMARTLLDISLFRQADAYVLVTGLTLVSPLVALGRIPPVAEVTREAVMEDRLARTIRPLFDWVLAPLVWLSALVLHLYLARLLLEGGPSLGALAGADALWSLGIFCTLALVLRIGADPFLQDGPRPLRSFRHAWAGLLVLPVFALALAHWRAIGAVGLTPWDYYALLSTLALGLIVLLQVVPGARGDIRWMVAVPATLFALSCVGPWGVVESVTRSQLAFFASLRPDEWQPAGPEQRARLRDRLWQLEDVGSLGEIRPLLPPYIASGSTEAEGSLSVAQIATRLGLDDVPQTAPDTRTFTASPSQVVSSQGYDLAALEVQVGPAGPANGRLALTLQRGTNWLALQFDAQTDRMDLGGLTAHLAEIGESASEPVMWDALTERGRHVRLWVRQATFQPDSGSLLALSGAAFLRSTEWQANAQAD